MAGFENQLMRTSGRKDKMLELERIPAKEMS
jgi:hypothetical protein